MAVELTGAGAPRVPLDGDRLLLAGGELDARAALDLGGDTGRDPDVGRRGAERYPRHRERAAAGVLHRERACVLGAVAFERDVLDPALGPADLELSVRRRLGGRTLGRCLRERAPSEAERERGGEQEGAPELDAVTYVGHAGSDPEGERRGASQRHEGC